MKQAIIPVIDAAVAEAVKERDAEVAERDVAALAEKLAHAEQRVAGLADELKMLLDSFGHHGDMGESGECSLSCPACGPHPAPARVGGGEVMEIRMDKSDVEVQEILEECEECTVGPVTHWVVIHLRSAGTETVEGRYCKACAEYVARRIQDGLPDAPLETP